MRYSPVTAGRRSPLEYAKLVRMSTSCRGKGLRGTAITWETHSFPGSSAFVVEMPPGGISARSAERQARAAITSRRAVEMTRLIVALAAPSWCRRRRGAGVGGLGAPPASRSAATKPPIHKMLIPYPKKRKREMAAYSKRHYGQYKWRLATRR